MLNARIPDRVLACNGHRFVSSGCDALIARSDGALLISAVTP
jgi:hypothetical protein